jgi:hypothetical protein
MQSKIEAAAIAKAANIETGSQWTKDDFILNAMKNTIPLQRLYKMFNRLID